MLIFVSDWSCFCVYDAPDWNFLCSYLFQIGAVFAFMLLQIRVFVFMLAIDWSCFCVHIYS